MEEENKGVNGEGEQPKPEEGNPGESPNPNNDGSKKEGEGEGEGNGEQKFVPYSRFKEVNNKVKELENAINNTNNLQAKKDEGKALTPEEQKDLNAKNYLKGLLKETLEEQEKSKQEATAKELKEFNASVDNVLEINPDVKKDEFLKFIEENEDKYKFSSVDGAMAIYKDLNKVKSEAKEQGKKEVQNRPKFPANEGSPAPKSYDTKGKSFSQIAEEAKRELEGQ